MALLGLINVVGPRETHDGPEIDQCSVVGGVNEGGNEGRKRRRNGFGGVAGRSPMRREEGGTKQRPHCIGWRRDSGGRDSGGDLQRGRRSDYNMASWGWGTW